MRQDSEIVSLLTLIDDPDMVVQKAVYERLYKLGEEAVCRLKSMREGSVKILPDETLAELIEHLREEGLVRKIEESVSSSSPFIGRELLLISSLFDPELDYSSVESYIFDIRDEIMAEMGDAKTLIENYQIFNYIFYFRLGFKGIEDAEFDDQGILIHKTLVARKGPLYSVMVLYVMLCRYCNMPVYPKVTNEGIYVAYLDNDDKILFYIDISKGGKVIPYNSDSKIERESSDRSLLSSYVSNLIAYSISINNINKKKLMQRVAEILS